MISGQTFCDLQTLLNTFFGFSDACCKESFIIFWVKGWDFSGLWESKITNLKQNQVQNIFSNLICVIYRHLFTVWSKGNSRIKITAKKIPCSLQMNKFVHKKHTDSAKHNICSNWLSGNTGPWTKFLKCHARNVCKSQNTVMPVFFSSMIISLHVNHLALIRPLQTIVKAPRSAPSEILCIWLFCDLQTHLVFCDWQIHFS